MDWLQLCIRFIVSGGLVVGASELAKKYELMGALIASLPLVSLLAIIWLYTDTGDSTRVAGFSYGIFWLVLPSLLLFIILPTLINRGVDFWPALAVASLLTITAYLVGIRMGEMVWSSA
ncbi:MAG: hypothetical protein CMA63_01530 [Euryarchaeota archaeon]|nr:hypothetical protein [Euryarchaeota archaeon]|tara:strand:+ start:33253 stop:33609 length:357 start_codon:yes stop_codon:yes gene_type:complete